MTASDQAAILAEKDIHGGCFSDQHHPV